MTCEPPDDLTADDYDEVVAMSDLADAIVRLKRIGWSKSEIIYEVDQTWEAEA